MMLKAVIIGLFIGVAVTVNGDDDTGTEDLKFDLHLDTIDGGTLPAHTADADAQRR